MDFNVKKINFYTLKKAHLWLFYNKSLYFDSYEPKYRVFYRLTIKWMRGCAVIGGFLPSMRQSSWGYTSKNLKCGEGSMFYLVYISLHQTSVQSTTTTTAGRTTAGRTSTHLTTAVSTANAQLLLSELLAVMEELLTSLHTDLLE